MPDTVKPAAPATGASDTFDLPPDVTRNLVALAELCAGTLGKSVQHFQGDDAWVIGAIPSFTDAAEAAESSIRAALSDATGAGTHQTEALRAAGMVTTDLRCVGRCARQAAQLSWLLRQGGGTWAFGLLCTVGEASATVAAHTTSALTTRNRQAARHAALLFREVDIARKQAEDALHAGAATLPSDQRRMLLSTVYFLSVGGESMARVAARSDLFWRRR